MSIEGSRYTAGQFHEGELLSAEKLNQLGLAADRGRTYHSSGVSTIQGPFGTIFLDSEVATQQFYDYPFKITVTGGASPGQFKVYVRAGTVNSFVATYKDSPSAGKYLDEVPNEGMLLSSASSSVKYIVLRASVDATKKFFPNKSEVYMTDDPESLVDSENYGHLLLGTLSLNKTGSTITGIASVNQFIYTSLCLIRVKGGASSTVWNWTSR